MMRSIEGQNGRGDDLGRDSGKEWRGREGNVELGSTDGRKDGESEGALNGSRVRC